MPTKRAYVYKVSVLGVDTYRVFPPVMVIEKNDTFEVSNTVDGHDAFLTIPAGPFAEGGVQGERVAPKSRSKARTPKGAAQVIEYEVKVDGKKAIANSDPVIIIDM